MQLKKHVRCAAWVWPALLAGGVAVSTTTVAGSAQMVASAAPAAGAAASLPPMAPRETKFFPLSEIRRGQHAVAYTVFEGVKPEPMDVEILGVLKDAIGPGRDMILARLKGSKPEYTGVVAGMSGSPVYIDGKLIGALSYRIGQFSKEPIAGITPIQQMLEVRDGQRGPGMKLVESEQVDSSAALRNDNSLGSLPRAAAGTAVSGGGEVQPIDTALVFGGFSQDTVALFGDKFRAMGMKPVAGLGGAAEPGTKQPEPIVPGSAVSAVLVRGDLSISGTCTVTYVDPHQLLACGHPITQFGPVSMPMTKAEVVTTLASPLDSFKIINTTETVGSFTQDRASAILGQFGVTAPMIPVSVKIVPATAAGERLAENVMPRVERVGRQIPQLEVPEQRALPGGKGGMHFEVLNNRELTPAAMLVSVYQSLAATNSSANDMSYRMRGELTLKGLPPIHLDGVMAPSESQSGAINAALYVNERFAKLYSNTVEQPQVTGLKLSMEAIPARMTAVLEGARLAQTEARPGDVVDVEATLHPYGSSAQVVRMKLKLPDSLTPEPLRLVVGDGPTLDRLETPGAAGAGAQHALALTDAIAQMNSTHANSGIYVALLKHAAQAGLETEALPDIPISMANVLEPLKADHKLQLNGESVIEAGAVQTNYAVSGSQVLTLDVK